MRSGRTAFLLLLLGSPLVASAQISASNNEPSSHFFAPVTTISKAVDEVDLAFTVTDKRGHFIGNLQPEDFVLLDNHVAPQRLTFFQQRSDLPLHLAILIDASESVKDTLKFEQNAARMFLKKILRPGTDEAFIVAFNGQVTTIQQPTDRMAKAYKAIGEVKGGGDTALYDAVIYASQQLRQMPEHEITRRGIIVISDGVDTVKRSTLQDAKQAAGRADVMIFSVSTNTTGLNINPEGDAALKELAMSSGGVLLRAQDGDDVQAAFNHVNKALRNQYVIAYNPADFRADGSYRTLELVPHKRGLRMNYRKGYYAAVRQLMRKSIPDALSLGSLVNALH